MRLTPGCSCGGRSGTGLSGRGISRSPCLRLPAHHGGSVLRSGGRPDSVRTGNTGPDPAGRGGQKCLDVLEVGEFLIYGSTRTVHIYFF